MGFCCYSLIFPWFPLLNVLKVNTVSNQMGLPEILTLNSQFMETQKKKTTVFGNSILLEVTKSKWSHWVVFNMAWLFPGKGNCFGACSGKVSWRHPEAGSLQAKRGRKQILPSGSSGGTQPQPHLNLQLLPPKLEENRTNRVSVAEATVGGIFSARNLASSFMPLN